MKNQIARMQQNSVSAHIAKQRLKSPESGNNSGAVNEFSARSAIKDSERLLMLKTKQQLNAQCEELQSLANELSSTIETKEVILDSLRFANTFLGKRVIALECLNQMSPGQVIENVDELVMSVVKSSTTRDMPTHSTDTAADSPSREIEEHKENDEIVETERKHDDVETGNVREIDPTTAIATTAATMSETAAVDDVREEEEQEVIVRDRGQSVKDLVQQIETTSASPPPVTQSVANDKHNQEAEEEEEQERVQKQTMLNYLTDSKK